MPEWNLQRFAEIDECIGLHSMFTWEILRVDGLDGSVWILPWRLFLWRRQFSVDAFQEWIFGIVASCELRGRFVCQYAQLNHERHLSSRPLLSCVEWRSDPVCGRSQLVVDGTGRRD